MGNLDSERDVASQAAISMSSVGEMQAAGSVGDVGLESMVFITDDDDEASDLFDVPLALRLRSKTVVRSTANTVEPKSLKKSLKAKRGNKK